MGNNYPKEDIKEISCEDGDLPTLNIISKTEVKLQRNHEYKQYVTFKPFGLWIGICNSWHNYWYIDEQMDTMEGKFIYEVKLFPNVYTTQKRYRKGKYPKKILIIETLDDIDYITKEYGRKDKNNSLENFLIDWFKFSERYAGIEFRNYIKDFDVRMKYVWYSTVDVNSLCIWDLSLVKEIKLHNSM